MQSIALRTSFVPVLVAFGATSVALASYESGYAHFGKVSDTIQVLGNTHFNSGDYTYEMNIRLAPGSGFGHIISEQRDTYEDKTMRLAADGSYTFSGACNYGEPGDMAGTIPGLGAGEWMHLAYVRRSGIATIYINGEARVERLAPLAYGDHDGSWMSIGMFRYGAGWGPTEARDSFLGDLDWIRVSAGARYTSNFIAPTESQIAADASTQLLLRFNEAAGTSVLVDESSNHFICNMGVPVYPGVVGTAPTLMYGAVPAPGALVVLVASAVLGRSRRRSEAAAARHVHSTASAPRFDAACGYR
jgi:hypothetical protein